ncbi:interleukin-4 receptor subunit alpha-like [Sander lucioperca]|uniref:interleukin-4 receptor subunit alpha-like n=1 Tax=Sander lucioperca TaxID=283035 RepID=UPI001653CE56|nr:interleukin-4 receptor subunit alpha-like [Sander lucioperca]
MKCLPFMFVCWCSSILPVTSCIKVDGYSCVTAFWNTITCVLNITGNPVGPNTTYSLEFIDNEERISCPLVVTNHSYSCVCKIRKDSHVFSSYDEYDLKLCYESSCHSLTEHFQPTQNIELTPPHQAEVQQTPKTFNITWKNGYEDHQYLDNGLDYELLLQTSQSTENKILRSNSLESYLLIQRSILKPNAIYCIQVRSIPNSVDYNATWSKWSPSTCWENEAAEEQDYTLVILIKSLGPVCVAVGVLLFVFCSPAARLKIKTLSQTPSPAPFFQPLFQQHEGNLQKWLSHQHQFVLTYKTEETLTIDPVIVVPKPIKKDPEENQDFHNPPVTQLAFHQCQASYVGLPGIHEASPPLTMVCPGDMPYTQLPCSVWGVGIKEVKVVCTPPEDFLNMSRADSGCSCEDLTQSPECSLPNNPIDDSPPPCFCSDYCILNKTAEGFAPVLMSKGSSLNVPSNSLQECES